MTVADRDVRATSQGRPGPLLFVSTGGNVGGSELCLLRLMAGLRARGRHTVLACPPASALAARGGDEGATLWPLQAPDVLDPAAAYDLVSPELGLPGPGRWGRRLTAGRRALQTGPAAVRLARAARRAGVQLVHSNAPRASLVGGVAARLAGVPSVTHVRDIVLSPFRKRARRLVLRLATDVFIAPSQATADVVGGLRPVHVIHDGLPARALAETRPHRPLETNAPEIGMVAAMTPWKGHEVLIRAVPAILRTRPHARVTILGGDWGHPVFAAYRARLEQLVRDLGLADVVRLAGDVGNVMERLAAFDVFVHPPTAGDPFPGVLLEASQAGCAIVATATGGIPEMVRHDHSALLIPPGDAPALAAAVLRLLDDPALAARLGETARTEVRRFSLESEIEAMEAVYAGLAGVTTVA